MKKTVFSKVFSRETWMAAPFNERIVLLFVFLFVPFIVTNCAKQNVDLPVIVKINGNPVYLNELEMLGRLAASEKGVNFDSVQGQQHYRSIAPNLYKTLIDIYVMKYTAERDGFTPTPEELETEFVQFKENLQKQGIYEDFLKQVQIDEARLKETLKDRFAIQKLKQNKLDGIEVEVTDQEVRDFYYQNIKQYKYPYLMRASHIFVSAPKTESPEKRESARIRIEQLRKMIGDDPSKTFVGLAREHSEDRYTSARGGDLGFIYSNGNLMKSFKDAAFALEEGEVSDIVETDLGYHVIWATDREQSFEEAKKTVRDMKIQQKKAEKFALWLEDAAKQLNVVKLFDPVAFKVLKEESGE